MKKQKLMLLGLCAALCLMGAALSVHAQSAQTGPTEESNLDTQLHILVGTNQDVADPKLPASLDTVIRQLRATLPFKNYRLAATLINRVKNEGKLDLSWVGGPLAPVGASTASTPSFSTFRLRQLKLVRTDEGQQVQMLGFYFGARIPIQVNSPVAAATGVPPVFNYEQTGVSTDISMREGEPVIVGTLNVGPSGDAIILVVSAKRTPK
jgi:hypothetical protein